MVHWINLVLWAALRLCLVGLCQLDIEVVSSFLIKYDVKEKERWNLFQIPIHEIIKVQIGKCGRRWI